jgi:hypothetical protein
MPDAVSWATPLLVLPGVGLLLVSTSARYEAIHAEIHQLLDDPSEQAIGCTLHVVHRARILRLAMLSLYVSASLLAASGLIAALTVGFLGAVHWASWVLLVAGVSCVLIAVVTLTREAGISLAIVEAHASEIESRSD